MGVGRGTVTWVGRLLAVFAMALPWLIAPASAQDDARMRQLRLLCVQLSGDLTDPGGIAAFRRCLTTHNPIGEIKRDNNLGGGGGAGRGGGGGAVATDRPGANPPKGFGRDTRRNLASGVWRFETRDGEVVYAIDKDSKLWRGIPSTKEAQVVSEKAADLALVDDAHLLMLDTDGRLWRIGIDGSDRTKIDETVDSFQLVNGVIYVRGTDGKLWRETGDSSNRALVDQQVIAFQATDGNVIYVLGNDGKLWRETGDSSNRTMIASTIVAFQFVPRDDTTYVLGRDGILWSEQGENGKPAQVDHNVAAFQAMGQHVICVLGTDGRLWRELGSRDHAVLVDRGLMVTAGRAAFDASDPQHIFVLGADHQLWAETMPAGQ
jgi:alpha-tubulin suppressor-like RCC1 family protein